MKRKMNINCYCADFETTSRTQYVKEGLTRVYLWEIKSLDGKQKWVGVSMDEFIELVKSFPNDSDVFFHNLSFDGEFLLNFIVGHGFTYNVKKDELDNCDFTTITDEMGTHYLIKVRFENGTLVNFKCSYRLMPISIANLGKIIGVHKLTEIHDYTEIKDFKTIADVPEKELMYLENDVEIMRLVLIYLFDMGLKGVTMASASYNYWKKEKYFFMRELPVIEDDSINDIISMSYHGGITMVNPIHQGKLLDSFVSYDVNSLYPSAMLGNPMPIGMPVVYKTLAEAMTDKFHSLRLIHLVVHEAKVHSGYLPFIPFGTSFMYKGAYVYPTQFQDKEIALWENEYDLFLDYYDVSSTIVDVVAFAEKPDVFTNYLTYWKTIKETTDDKVLRTIAKLMMNALYGKFGQKPERLTKIPDHFDEKGVLRYSSMETSGGYFYRPIASYITSCARTVLINAMEREHDRFIYCDTDSLYLTGSAEGNIPIDPKKIGYWKYEGHYTKGLFLKAKGYLKTHDDGEQESGVAGLPKELQKKLTYENFKDGLKFIGAKKVLKRVKGGIIIDNTDFTLKIKGELVEII